MALAPDDPIWALGQAIARRRNALHLSQQALAERLGLASSESISRYERGEREPRVMTLLRIADALETTPEHLLVDAGLVEPSAPKPTAASAGDGDVLRAALHEGLDAMVRYLVDQRRRDG